MAAKTVADKLLIKPNTTVWSSHPSNLSLIDPLPEGVRPVDGIEEASTALVFADDADSLRGILTNHQAQLTQPSLFWVAYRKGNKTLNRDSLWPIVVEYGLRPIAQVAVDDTWSALRFRPPHEGEAPFTGGR
jgi:hypothetical protein